MKRVLAVAGASLVTGLCFLSAACGDDTSDGGGGDTTTTSTTATTGTGTGSSTSSGGQCLMFGADCTTGDTCCAVGSTPGECYAFGMGSKCTIPCPANPADCPNNGQGCNSMTPAYCKSN
jgi:hypothetical protein